MKLRTLVKRSIDNQEPGKLFNIKDVAPAGAELVDISKSLSLYYRRGVIAKLTKGLYYKPKKGPISGRDLPPNLDDILSKIKVVQGATVFYPTGVLAYNGLFITTQMSTVIDIATDKPRSSIAVAGTKLNFIKSRIRVPVHYPKLAQILDALQDVKTIPGVTPKEVCIKITAALQAMKSSQWETIVEYAQYYPSRVRALLGMCFDLAGQVSFATRLRDGLAKTKQYDVGLDSTALTTTLLWNIR